MHIPVLKQEVLKYLNPKPNENFIDCTTGNAGHTLAILKKNAPRGKVLALELDDKLCRILKQKSLKWNFKKRLILVNDDFVNLKKIVERKKFKKISGILFDLGVSKWHLEKSGRGFSFLRDEPLDMRYGHESLTAREILNCWSEKEISGILKEYGEERFARNIAEQIARERKIKPIETTWQLVAIIKKATPSWYQQKRIHPGTKSWQALRVAVNQELEKLRKALPQALKVLMPGGKMAVISFHSLEDKIVKGFLKEEARQKNIKVLTKKPFIATKAEIKLNPSSRSAKLRAGCKL